MSVNLISIKSYIILQAAASKICNLLQNLQTRNLYKCDIQYLIYHIADSLNN